MTPRAKTMRCSFDGPDLFQASEAMSPEELNRILGLADDEIIIDLFAGGGGASEGIEWATGRSPDEAVNHSAPALAIHELNHPKTRHWQSDVWEADPIEVAAGRKVGLLWMSPDCTHFSRAKGAKPVSKKIRVLAHVAIRYAVAVRPRVIMLENVAEFQGWGPVSRTTGKPDPLRKGKSFRNFVRQLRRLGYDVDWRLLRADEQGAPTTRERLFLVARCDGAPIRFPEPTHGEGYATPVRVAAECIDFSIPCPSIFLTADEARELGKTLGRRIKRPLVTKSCRRIARGVYRFVIDAANPFIIPVTHAGDDRVYSINEPMRTITGANRGEFAVVDASIAPLLVPRYGEDPHRNGGAGQEPRSRSVERPLPTIVPSGNGAQLVSAFLAKYYGDTGQRPGSSMQEPINTITPHDHNVVVAAHLTKLKGTAKDGHPVTEPLATIQSQGNHHALTISSLVQFNRNCDGRSLNEPIPVIMPRDKFAEVRAFLTTYYGTATGAGGDLRKPLRTVTPHDRLALVTVRGIDYAIFDIGMRMLTARELANGQGFRPTYILDGWYLKRTKKGAMVRRRITETDQKKMVGNTVNPQLAYALVVANFGRPARLERAA